LTFELDLDKVKIDQLAKNVGQSSFSLEDIVQAHRHVTHWTDYATWTTEAVCNTHNHIMAIGSSMNNVTLEGREEVQTSVTICDIRVGTG